MCSYARIYFVWGGFLENKNNILFDWLSFTSHVDSVHSVIQLLGLGDCNIPWETTYGIHGYRDRFHFDGININFNGFREDMGIFVEMSGQGCRRFEESSNIDFIKLFNLISDTDSYNITRLDIAYDDYEKILNLNKIIKDLHKFNFVSKFQEKSIRIEEHAGHSGQTVYLGSNKSAVMFRIYDKKFERNRDDLEHWVRFEIQLRQERASAFVHQLLKNEFTIGQGFFGVVNNYIRFVSPSFTDSNKRRWELRPYWSKFLQYIDSIQLYTSHNTEYNLMRCENYVHKQCSNSIECLVNAKGIDKFFLDMIQNKPDYSEKYNRLAKNNDAILDFLRERGALHV